MVTRRPQPGACVRCGLTVGALDGIDRSRPGCTVGDRCHVVRRERPDVVAGRPLDLFFIDPERDDCHLEDARRRRIGGARAPPRVLRAGGPPPGGCVLHPDGRFLYFTRTWDYLGPASVNEIWRMPVDGGEETLVVTGIKSYRTFVVGRRGVYYAHGESGRDSIRVHDLTTGRSHVVLELSKPIAPGLSLSPDERYLLYSQVDDEGSELMLVDNFR